jgi:hypothetical protein
MRFEVLHKFVDEINSGRGFGFGNSYEALIDLL